MNGNRFVIFDIGNVLAHCDFYNLIQLLSYELSISEQDILNFLNRLHIEHDLGKTNLNDEFIKSFPRHTHLSNLLLKEWELAINFESSMIHLLNRLYDNGINIAILSNIGIEHADLVDSWLAQEKFYEFSAKWFSCDQGVRKPDAEYYYKFLKHHPEFSGCYYFDDIQDNLETGLKFGLKSQRFALSDYFYSKIGTTLSNQKLYIEGQDHLKNKDREFEQKILEIEKMILGE